MKGLEYISGTGEEEIDALVERAKKEGSIDLPMLTRNSQGTFVTLECSKQPQGFTRVCIDTFKSNWDITPDGQKAFEEMERRLPDSDDRRNVFCGKRVMRIEVKETGEGLVLAYMLGFLEAGENLEEVGSSPS